MRRRTFFSLTASSITTALIGCGGGKSSSQGPLLRLLTLPKTSMSPLHLAEEEGYFREVGLRVEMHPLTRSIQMIPLLASGRFDAGMVSVSAALINAVEKGAQLRIVAAREYASSTCGTADTLYGSADVFPDGFSDLRVLQGKRLAFVGPYTKSELFLDLILDRGGLASNDIHLVFLQQRDAVAALKGGRIDAMISSHFEKDPSVVSTGYVKGPGLGDFLPGLQRGFIAFGPSLLQADLSVGTRFLSAYLRGVNEFADGRTPAFLERIARANGIDPEKASRACRDSFVRDGHIDRKGVEQVVAWAVGKGYCPKTARTEKLIDESYLSEIQVG